MEIFPGMVVDAIGLLRPAAFVTKNNARLLTPSLARTTTMSVLLLCWLASAVVASPLDYFLQGSPQVPLIQAGTAKQQATGNAELGWFDPRLNGGRLLDVSDLQEYSCDTDLRKTLPVHYQEVRGTSECYYLWIVRPLRVDRLWLWFLYQVRHRIKLFNGAACLLDS